MNLSRRQERFVSELIVTRNGSESARRAGYSSKSAHVAASRLIRQVKVKAALAAKEADLARKVEIRQLDVVAGVIDGIELARMQCDSGNLIRGWTEIAKILGLDRPETVKRVASAESEVLRSKYEVLSDEELLAIASGVA